MDSFFTINFFLFFLVSLVDDIKGLPAMLRLIVQSLCVIISVYFIKDDITLFLNNLDIAIKLNVNESLLFYLLASIIFFSWLWLINLFNFMDGMDGLTALQMIFLALTINIISLMNFLIKTFSS